MQYDDTHSVQALRRYNNTVMQAALLRYYFKRYFHATPLNYHYQEATCYNAKCSFAMQFIGRYHAVEHYWQWGYSQPDYDPAFYAVVNRMREHTLAWNDDFFSQNRCFPADDILLSWLVNIAVSFGQTPLFILRRAQDGNVFDVLCVHDNTLINHLIQMYKSDAEPHEAVLAAWQSVSKFSALMYQPLRAVAAMASTFDIPLTQDGCFVSLTLLDKTIRFAHTPPDLMSDPVVVATTHDSVGQAT